MANKKKIEEREKILQAKRTEQTVQRVGIAVIALVVIGLAFVLVRNRNTQPAASDDLFPTLAPVATEPAVQQPPPPEVSGKQYASYPDMVIDASKKYFATFKLTNGGEFTAELFADKTPLTVNNFVFLARDGFYDGVTFHRVIDGFMAQGGDPTGTGTGGPGYAFDDEIVDSLVFDRGGLLAMANSGPATNGSQFFITFAATEWLNGAHTIFGEITEGIDVVNSITRREPGSSTPGDVIETITITEE